MNITDVRRMRNREHRDFTLNLPPQRVTLRCECGWYLKSVLASEASELHKQHLKGNHKNRKRGPQQRTADQHAGRDWGRR